MVSFFAKRFIIMVSFMNRFFYSPFVQETKFYEPIYEPIHMKAFVPRALKQVPEQLRVLSCRFDIVFAHSRLGGRVCNADTLS